MQILRGRTASVDKLLISSDGRYLAVGSVYCHVWDLRNPTAKPRAISTNTSGDWVQDLQFLTSTQLLVRMSIQASCLHDLDSGEATDLSRRESMPWHATVCVHPSGESLKVLTRIAPGSGSGESVSYTVHLGRRVSPPDADTPGPLLEALFGFSPDGTRYLAAANLTGEPARKHHLFDTATDAVVTTFERPPGGYYSHACTWCFQPDGRWLFVVASRRLLRYDCTTGGQPVALLTLPKSEVRASPPIAIHPGGHVLATVEDGRAVTFRDAETLEVLRTYDFAMPTVTCVAFTPDGTRCVIGNSRGKVLLFDVD